MSIRRVWEIPDEKSIMGAINRYSQNGYLTSVNLISETRPYVGGTKKRYYFFPAGAGYEPKGWRPGGNWKWSQCGGKEAWEEKGDRVLMTSFDPSLQQALPHTFKLYAPMHSFWVDKSVYCLQVKESYGLNHWPQGCWKIRDACWVTWVGWSHWNEIHRAHQAAVEMFYCLSWIVMCVDFSCFSLCFACMKNLRKQNFI